MHIIIHPMLAAQRAVLDLPQADRRGAILRLLTPFDPVVRTMVPPGVDPIHSLRPSSTGRRPSAPG